MDAERNTQRSRSAVRPQLEWRATPVSARGPLSLSLSLPLSLAPSLSLCRLSLCVQLDMQEPLNLPPLNPASSSRIQASSAQPCVVISGNSFRMLPVHCIHSFLSLSLPLFFCVRHSTPTSPHNYMSSSLLFVPLTRFIFSHTCCKHFSLSDALSTQMCCFAEQTFSTLFDPSIYLFFGLSVR